MWVLAPKFKTVNASPRTSRASKLLTFPSTEADFPLCTATDGRWMRKILRVNDEGWNSQKQLELNQVKTLEKDTIHKAWCQQKPSVEVSPSSLRKF